MVASRQASSDFYQDLDARGDRLNGANRYSVTSAKDQLAPARGFWSLALCNEHHFFDPNDQHRYSLGTKNDTLQPNTEGSLTLHIGARRTITATCPTGFPPRTTASRSTCAPIGRKRRFLRAAGRLPRSNNGA